MITRVFKNSKQVVICITKPNYVVHARFLILNFGDLGDYENDTGNNAVHEIHVRLRTTITPPIKGFPLQL